jgi:hypothetical protein
MLTDCTNAINAETTLAGGRKPNSRIADLTASQNNKRHHDHEFATQESKARVRHINERVSCTRADTLVALRRMPAHEPVGSANASASRKGGLVRSIRTLVSGISLARGESCALPTHHRRLLERML